MKATEWDSNLDSSVQCKRKKFVSFEESVNAFCKFHEVRPQEPSSLARPGMFLVAAVDDSNLPKVVSGRLHLRCEPNEKMRNMMIEKLSPLD